MVHEREFIERALAAVLRDVLTALIRHGAMRIVVLNGHFENAMVICEAIDLALREAAILDRRGVRVMRLEYWDYITPDTVAALFPDGRPRMELEHAALMETSLMLHDRPDLVDLAKAPQEDGARFPLYDMFPASRDGVPASGALSPAGRASAAFGAWLAADCVAGIRRDIAREFGA